MNFMNSKNKLLKNLQTSKWANNKTEFNEVNREIKKLMLEMGADEYKKILKKEKVSKKNKKRT